MALAESVQGDPAHTQTYKLPCTIICVRVHVMSTMKAHA